MKMLKMIAVLLLVLTSQALLSAEEKNAVKEAEKTPAPVTTAAPVTETPASSPAPTYTPAPTTTAPTTAAPTTPPASPEERQRLYAEYKKTAEAACDQVSKALGDALPFSDAIEVKVEGMKKRHLEYAAAKKEGADETKLKALAAAYKGELDHLHFLRLRYLKKVKKAWDELRACDMDGFSEEIKADKDYRLIKRMVGLYSELGTPVSAVSAYLRPYYEECDKVTAAKGIADSEKATKAQIAEITAEAARNLLERNAEAAEKEESEQKAKSRY